MKAVRDVVQIWEEKTSLCIHFSKTKPNLDEDLFHWKQGKSRARETEWLV